ncbi:MULTISPECIES: DUF732 domain-containing protein [Mycobacterium]|uniref:DUF732 domain-containing protein n=1 Tax=Mycobacterium kiyosense TaxID=2871094 RepID=A0A9P3QC79_9MYCO|nr:MULTISPECIES: DUF732 domain-containing protein [Mycobacterium]BDB41247.1 hypothetical protein IWGMT90018_16930 [Mycobacterium kiyosense]BDE13003.1 hypothetical protein MKCMC460_18630 [Mycobacterium sp. 20KCMC460]GLB82861.1 hypothetical protein SRL2020028_21170 [Mycobacterium kiyosense]GLB92136.1 hypothetical protein SRL2020130_49530 [Mycobacterium kiyosense]GLB98355.1 hypothetical protein SRL2020226_51310 [Mycobacterium kiyosense]
MVDPVGGADSNTGANADSSSLAWSSGTEVPDIQSTPAGDARDSRDVPAAEPAVVEQSWGTAWGRALAVLLICLGLAAVIVVAGLLLASNDSTPTVTATQPTSKAPQAPATTTEIVSTPEQDRRFIAALNEKGIVFKNPDAAVANGKAVCQSFAANLSLEQVVAQFQQVSPDFSDHADDIVAVSVRAYCPQYSKLVAGI